LDVTLKCWNNKAPGGQQHVHVNNVTIQEHIFRDDDKITLQHMDHRQRLHLPFIRSDRVLAWENKELNFISIFLAFILFSFSRR
jgi:hypothetical protein